MPIHPFHVIRLAATAVAAAYAASCLAHALRAAGVTSKAPQNAAAIEKFVGAITDNALWIIGTVVGLAVVIGGLCFFGHSRAADYALKMLIGSVVMVSASGIAA